MIDKVNLNTISSTQSTAYVTGGDNQSDKVSFEDSFTKEYTLDELFDMASEKYNVPKQLLVAVTKAESDFTPDATSYCDARGLMQIMPSAAEFLGVEDRYDPMQNIFGGAKYYSYLLDRYDGDLDLAIAGYGAGVGNVKKYGGVPPFCEDYIKKIHRYIENGVTVPNKTVTVNTLSAATVLDPNDRGAFKGDLIVDGVNLTQSEYNKSDISYFDVVSNNVTGNYIGNNSSSNEISKDSYTNTSIIETSVDILLSDSKINSSSFLEAFHNYNAYMKVLDILENTQLNDSKDNEKNER